MQIRLHTGTVNSIMRLKLKDERSKIKGAEEYGWWIYRKAGRRSMK